MPGFTSARLYRPIETEIWHYQEDDANSLFHCRFDDAAWPAVDAIAGNNWQYSSHGYDAADHAHDDHGMQYRSPGANGLLYSMGFGPWNMEPWDSGGETYPPYVGRKMMHQALSSPITIGQDESFVLLFLFQRTEPWWGVISYPPYLPADQWDLYSDSLGGAFFYLLPASPFSYPASQAILKMERYFTSGSQGYNDPYEGITFHWYRYPAEGQAVRYTATWRQAAQYLQGTQWHEVVLVVDKTVANPLLWIDGQQMGAPLTGFFWGTEVAMVRDVGSMTFPAGQLLQSGISSGHSVVHQTTPPTMHGDFRYPFFGFTYKPFYWQEMWWHKGTTWNSNY